MNKDQRRQVSLRPGFKYLVTLYRTQMHKYVEKFKILAILKKTRFP